MHWVFQSEDWYGNVVFNFRPNPIGDLAAFAAGYHEAGKRLCERLANSHGYRDFDGYPILFLYRHSLELYMKAILYRGAQLLHLLDVTRPDTSKMFRVHRLSELLAGIKIIFDGVGWNWETDIPGMRTFQEFSGLLEGVEELDPVSYTFRYPTDTQGHAALGHHTLVNCLAFGSNLDPILELLDGAVTGLTEGFNTTAEAKFELQQMTTGDDL